MPDDEEELAALSGLMRDMWREDDIWLGLGLPAADELAASAGTPLDPLSEAGRTQRLAPSEAGSAEAPDQRPASAAAAASSAPAHAASAAAAASPPTSPPENGRVPRETDAAWLLQSLAVKDALLKQMEAAMLRPPLDTSYVTSSSLGRKAQALIANARRREAVMALKLNGLLAEVALFRKRELRAAQLNAQLRRRLRLTLEDYDANKLRREVRTLRADLHAAREREAIHENDMRLARLRIEADGAMLAASGATERRLREDLEYVRGVAVHAMAARADIAIGDR